MTQSKDKEQNEFQKKIEDQQKTIEEYTNTLRRLQADFENYIKRAEREKEDHTKYSNHKLLIKLLIIADDFEKALEAATKNTSNMVQGIEMMQKQLHKILHEEGITPIQSVGHKLDPYKHEVIDIITGNKDDVIVEEIQKGYMMQNKVLRTSKVKISKANGK